MSNFITIATNEFSHFARSPFKVLFLILFVFTAIYGLQNGYSLFKDQTEEIAKAQEADAETKETALGYFKELEEGNTPARDITQPMWALYFAPVTAVKSPSLLMPFTIGQAQEFPYYKKVTEWSTTFDNDLAEELGNPEHLASGQLDFSFVVLYLLPVLLIVLLFNVGGLEQDLNFDRLIRVNSLSRSKWLFARFSFYIVLIAVLLVIVMLPYAAMTGALQTDFLAFAKLFLLLLLYLGIWSSVLFFINFTGRGSTNQALKMVCVWLVFCIVIPGTVHQVASLKYPPNYMSEYTDAKRDKTNDIWYMQPDSIYTKLVALYPELQETKQGKDTVVNQGTMYDTSSALVNDLMKNTAEGIEQEFEEKNQFISNSYWINPVTFFQNKMNAIAANDYYAYKAFRDKIQEKISGKVEYRLFDSWEEKPITRERYQTYLETLND